MRSPRFMKHARPPGRVEKRNKNMGRKYEINYLVPDTGKMHHFSSADDIESAIFLMQECEKVTGSIYITLTWRTTAK